MLIRRPAPRPRLVGIALGLFVTACDDPRDDVADGSLEDAVHEEPAEAAAPLEAPSPQALTQGPAPAARVTGFSLEITKDADDIVLAWGAPLEGMAVEVWTSGDPFFAPGDPGAELLAAAITESSWTHEGGNDAVDRYYRVRAEGEPTTVSTTVGKLATTLQPGYTKIGLCLQSEVDTAAELFEDMASPVVSAHVWDAATQQWQWAWAEAPVELPLPTGAVVAVHHEGEAPIDPGFHTMIGHVPTPSDVQVDLEPGINIVTLLPWRGDLDTAAELLAATDHATRIGAWDAATQTTRWYPDGADFEVPDCSPVYVEVGEASSWPPLSYRQVIGPEGGTLVAYQGAIELEVPAGALTEAVELRITPTTYPLPEGDFRAFAFEPHGIEFAVPVVLQLGYRGGLDGLDGRGWPDGPDWLMGLDADPTRADLIRFAVDGTPTILGATHDPEAGTLTAELETFSYIGVMTRCPGEPGSMSVTPPNPSIPGGDQLELTARLYDGATPLPGRPATWLIDDPAVAVPTTGADTSMVTATGQGSALVYASIDTCWNMHVSDDTDPAVSIDVQTTVPLYGATSVSVPSCAERPVPCGGSDTTCALACDNGMCGPHPRNEGVGCGVSNTCRQDVCQAGTCTQQNLNEGGACGGSYTCGQQLCTAGSCTWQAQNPGASCAPANTCASYSCSGLGCNATYYDGAPCEADINPCTIDVCGGGACQHNSDLWCVFVFCFFSGICW